MNQDKLSGNDHDKASKQKEDGPDADLSSSAAMDAYFFDMLGSVADQQPLKKLEGADRQNSSRE